MQNLELLYGLSEDQRIDAKERARALIIRRAGDKPQPEQFRRAALPRPDRAQYADTHISRYPAWLTKAVGGVMLLVFVAAAMPSLFRLFTAGRDYFAHGINDPVQAAIVGLSTFLLAEFLIVLSTISARVYFTGRSRLLFAAPVAMGLAVALVGNWTITQPGDIFGWLETIVPPVSVVFIALVLEKLILDSIHARHANEKAYQAALNDWKQATADQQAAEESAYHDAVRRWQDMTREPEQADDWTQVYATALREGLRAANARGRGMRERVEVMQSLNGRDWSRLVRREMDQDRWYLMVFSEPVASDPRPAPVEHDPPRPAETTNTDDEDTQEAAPVRPT